MLKSRQATEEGTEKGGRVWGSSYPVQQRKMALKQKAPAADCSFEMEDFSPPEWGGGGGS